MLSFPAAIKVYLCTVPCDMRRSFDGLSMMAEHVIRCNPFSGHLLVFCNRRTDRLKILYWDRDGWVTWYKRLGGVLSLALFSIMGIPFYFSAAGYATVGYGDVVLPRCGGPLGPVESIIGVLMCGLSASFLFAIVTRLVERETKLSRELAKPLPAVSFVRSAGGVPRNRTSEDA